MFAPGPAAGAPRSPLSGYRYIEKGPSSTLRYCISHSETLSQCTTLVHCVAVQHDSMPMRGPMLPACQYASKVMHQVGARASASVCQRTNMVHRWARSTQQCGGVGATRTRDAGVEGGRDIVRMCEPRYTTGPHYLPQC